ncbi:bifunctional glutamate N-acetyltransferase/amino-acid acetyltransferase ArgJ [Vulgatibacter incomptus]|uniref:Arginine biosynthesis bifunctional protein ArgJ n=1 Tax=Vulgatibacter incomptus TaxID=1391653 RepID=A0A0K1PBB2_9BACT|nr:bifunctional glutamate N-acetyltransferase/amino-acid acetyltransferase ArgJ [Vulgatibacter incomptus]AKU90414.1 Glutamate N-acetyltransferase [Vulgatibacter incomptus]
MNLPLGFTFSGVPCGIKPHRRDLALVASDVPCAAAGVFTVNKAKAAPVLDAEARLPSAGVRAVVINAGNANALTGSAGPAAVAQVHAAIAEALGVSPEAVLSASTGVIGVPLPAQKIVAAAPALVADLKADAQPAAEAIMTTDTRKKLASRVVHLGGAEVTIAAICKGSGMIAPQLATMISVITTDCAIAPELLAGALRTAVKPTFNRLTVDDDMSTNDAVFAMANGMAGNAPLEAGSADLALFTEALSSLCEELAKEIAADGEGATKRLEIRVNGAPDEAIAEDVAKAIAGSSLVKAAIFGADPNWGRILSTVGARAGSQGFAIDPYGASVKIQDLVVYDGAPADADKTILKARMREPEVKVDVELRAGAASATAWGCDLSYDYVKINADYTSLIVQTPTGGVAKDERLSNYSPAFKVSLLVEALGYISRFKGQRCVIKYGGAAMTRESLKRSFCEDILLLRSVGLCPIVVHGGGPDITRALEKMGGTAEFIDGQRVTHASDLKVVEMVLTGSINTELVTLLNQRGANAVGLSGKDAALLEAKKLVREDGKDLGQVGELTKVNANLLELLLQRDYVPVISPVGLGEGGHGYNLNADVVAAGVAAAVGASKLIYLSDVPGILDGGELVSELNARTLREELNSGKISGGMTVKARSILRALEGGVSDVHVIDGRTPHSVIAELFTEHGVGTLIRAGEGDPSLKQVG